MEKENDGDEEEEKEEKEESFFKIFFNFEGTAQITFMQLFSLDVNVILFPWKKFRIDRKGRKVSAV